MNKRRVCLPCRKKIREELAAERAGFTRLPGAIVLGLVGAIAGGAGWAFIGVVTNAEIGYVAVGVGFLAGFCALLGAGGRKGTPIQTVAVFCAILGLVLGKYFSIAYFVKQQVPDLSYFDPRMVDFFVQFLPKTLSPFDALWAFLALGIAWRMAKPTEVAI